LTTLINVRVLADQALVHQAFLRILAVLFGTHAGHIILASPPERRVELPVVLPAATKRATACRGLKHSGTS
jgi:hypothetical protein